MHLNVLGLALALLILPMPADAACRCACVNGEVRALCSSTLDIPPICAPRVCPMVAPSPRPLDPLTLPPLGTRHCEQRQILNPYTRRYEWQQVCR